MLSLFPGNSRAACSLYLVLFLCEGVVCRCAVSDKVGFVQIVANLRPPSHFHRPERSNQSPIHHSQLSLDPRKHRPLYPARSNEAAAATTTLRRDLSNEMDDDLDGLNWQDPAAVLLYNCVALQLLIITLSGQLQVSLLYSKPLVNFV
jgi:hypothetical protein